MNRFVPAVTTTFQPMAFYTPQPMMVHAHTKPYGALALGAADTKKADPKKKAADKKDEKAAGEKSCSGEKGCSGKKDEKAGEKSCSGEKGCSGKK